MQPSREKSVLIVDDEPIVRESLKAWLDNSGYDVAVAEDGDKALAMVQHQDFAVAVIDLRLPGMDGIRVLKEAQRYRPGLKGIIITAYPSVETTTRAIRQGAADYITKPFEPEELEALIEKLSRQAGGISPTAEVEPKGEKFVPAKVEFANRAALRSLQEYKALYNWSIADPEGFWGSIANQLEWYKKWDRFLEYDFKDTPEARYFIGGQINVSYNCLDRHVNSWRRNKAALIWQGEPENDTQVYTYQRLLREVCRFANVLKKLGVKKGDTVSIYLPMVPELAIAMLACARIGAVHSVVFAGFGASALRDRILDSQSRILITADGYHHGGKEIRCKDNADAALKECPAVANVIVVKRLGANTEMKPPRDSWWLDQMGASDIADVCPPEKMQADSALFILYTSSSTEKPKAILHSQAGYLLHCHQSMKWIFDIRDDDTYWCTADIGWITGHSYTIYGPLSTGATTVMFESVPTYPAPDRFWQIVDKYQVSILYTVPTVIRALMAEGEKWPNGHNLSSLRLLGSVGEPISPEAWDWYYSVIGKERCPIVDTWWQTETGGILITPLPGAIPAKPGSATMPFPGVEPVILKDDSSEAGINEEGWLCIKRPWPGMMRTIFNDPQRFKDAYFSQFPGYYCTNDAARRDEDGYFWIIGRIDDVIKVSGRRITTGEVERSLVSHPKVAEAVVVGVPHPVKGQGIYAYVTLKPGVAPGRELEDELDDHVRRQIGPIAIPDRVQFAEELPKTRSGKIVRGILTKIAAGKTEGLGDSRILANPTAVKTLIEQRP